ncbi:MAG: hypothetical protein KDD22_05735 [Bdellovibrionales bacterium]|nr:hypothetical protein [Bdellovibrionales bacterium]
MRRILVLLLTVSSLQAWAGHKIGNGGGLWRCNGTTGEIHDLMLVDFFEAKEEMHLQLRDYPNQGYLQIVSKVLDSAYMELPDYAEVWKKYLETVLVRMKIVNVELLPIDDAVPRARPKAETCPTFVWEYVQFANFNNFGMLEIRADYWEHKEVTEFEKAGLLWHEAIYLWLRENWQDDNSERARGITGLLFAEASIGEKKKLLKQFLGDDSQTKPEPDEMWFCMLPNRITHLLYGGYGPTQLRAISSAVSDCRNAPEGIHCAEFEGVCGPLESKTHFCTIRGPQSKLYSAEGRSQIEAIYKAHKACENANSSKVMFCEIEFAECDETP